MKRVTIYGLVSLAVALVFAAGAGVAWLSQPPPRKLTQADIDAAVMHTLQTKTLPSQAARAAEAIRESVVEIRSFAPETAPEPPPAAKAKRDPPDPKSKSAQKSSPKSAPKSAPNAGPPRDEAAASDPPRRSEQAQAKSEARHIGSGVVVTETGTIITNYHVVADASRLEVTFHNGQTSEASLLQAMPEKDLAIVQPKSIPDDLPAATLGSSQNLAPGMEVVAVGFPFGIGPSVSAGVISGLDRQFVSPDRKQKLDKLIQFDAAANPGNSGGPLVNMNGEVVGIVTAILNPHPSGTFLGIGFAITIESAGMALGSSPF
ncbi:MULTISPECIES: trypsin-like peptidase domain-containing protein [unclassified Cupriavidus]|jgi:S1-C subfamily serine protease|uniref:S1C family serine protease n=1 Tax=unclassified Cupriavidus TaxID=2640874 RepID=UPI001C003B90|nr:MULTISPECIES: trypsin-like peptidase domain-containing protein [unclassified Cupriavidus]MCA3185819.1 trypsin-like peptidase domain-containing protein [Cupriavidus sp.]MCA3190815.1 trypsin-like peptidase domain-containing protein [Cupriavidus sp.]MCA3199098.1 trypsin-like peptidase domain-containing protein [Cupriavidus sp.]MCA3205035.1 trypsin-like peptidase domain-containing protein [Cupriavidus sp.]MCA3209106.1 trypsin-like peptidase domain-containing protein [Cupriavidus sp.]